MTQICLDVGGSDRLYIYSTVCTAVCCRKLCVRSFIAIDEREDHTDLEYKNNKVYNVF